MQDFFEAWCGDPRQLTFGEFLAEMFEDVEGRRRLWRLGFLDERYRQDGVVPVSAVERAWADLYQECRCRIDLGERYAVCFVALNHFEKYATRYGLGHSERVISVLSRILHDVVEGFVARRGYVATIGGDRFIVIIPSAAIGPVCSEILNVFDTLIPYQYSDRDRKGAYSRVPLLTLSIGVVTNEERHFEHFAQVAQLAMEMLSYARTQTGSVFVVDRRTEA